jgi:hypothetical protein
MLPPGHEDVQASGIAEHTDLAERHVGGGSRPRSFPTGPVCSPASPTRKVALRACTVLSFAAETLASIEATVAGQRTLEDVGGLRHYGSSELKTGNQVSAILS